MGQGQIKMYKQNRIQKTTIQRNESTEGETIELKVERMLSNKEPIKDGAPLVYTEKKDGVMAGYNIRTDRFEVALDGITAIQKSKIAKREHAEKQNEQSKVIDLNAGSESTQGTDN